MPFVLQVSLSGILFGMFICLSCCLGVRRLPAVLVVEHQPILREFGCHPVQRGVQTGVWILVQQVKKTPVGHQHPAAVFPHVQNPKYCQALFEGAGTMFRLWLLACYVWSQAYAA